MRARKHLVAAVVGLGSSLVLAAGCGAIPAQTADDPPASTTPAPSLPSPADTAFGSPTPTPPPIPTPTATPTRTPTPTPSPTKSGSPSPEPSRKPRPKPTEKPSDKTSEPVKPGGSRTIYLTFDDGPSSYTGRVLDILARYDAKATFFVIGENVAGRASLVRRAEDAGHSIQNHTWNHPDLRTLSSEQIRSEIQRTDNAIRNAGGGRSTCVRPPYGATDAGVRTVLAGLGKRQVLWDIDTRDWQGRDADRIYRSVVEDAGSGSVVLVHDGGGTRTQTVAALPRILQTLRDKGYRFRALCS